MKRKTLALAGMNLLANLAVASNAAPTDATVRASTASSQPDGSRQINLASKVAVEQSWLDVPRMCKDRSFAFHPVEVGPEAPSAQVAALHAELDALTEA